MAVNRANQQHSFETNNGWGARTNVEYGFCTAGTPIAYKKQWEGSVRPTETIKAKAILPIEQSLDDQIAADGTDLDQGKSTKSEAEETKATSESDLSVTTKRLAAAETELAEASSSCMQVAADHEAAVASHTKEFAVIAKAKKILEETVSGAASQSWGNTG